MSIATSTLLLFFFITPGIIFRKFYYTEEFSREYIRESLFAVFTSTFFPSLILHIIWYLLCPFITGYEVDLNVLYNLTTSNQNLAAISNIEYYKFSIMGYNFTMIIFAGIAGNIFKTMVRVRKWDRKYKLFRFKNSWHYILKGEFFDFPKADMKLLNDKVEDIEFIFVDALVEVNDDTILYDGILVDYELSSNGGLDCISIKDVKRRSLSDDCKIDVNGGKEDNIEHYYPIDGHILVLKYENIMNLNFSYYKLTENDDGIMPRLVC